MRTVNMGHPGRRWRTWVIGAISLLLLLGPVGSTNAGGTARVRGLFNGSAYVWRPKTRSVAEGTTIRWKAVEGNHTVQSRGSNWSFFRSIPQGSSATRTFNQAGTYRYYCTIHGNVSGGTCSGMCGRIVVG